MKKLAVILIFPAFLIAARFIPFDRLPTLCLFRRMTGLPCPGCGMTRSVMALAHLHFRDSFRFNALGPIFVSMLAVWWLSALQAVFRGHQNHVETWTRRHSSILTALALTALLIFGILRILLISR
jgi:hypothetical protein